MYSSIVLGLSAIWLALVNLGVHWNMKVFWWGILIFGVLKVLENVRPIVVVVQKNRQPRASTV